MKDIADKILESIQSIQRIEGKPNMQVLADKINELVDKVNELAENAPKARDRGPASERTMTDEDARRVMVGDLKGLSHKAAAEQLGLSYGQVYSARNGYTFKPIYKEMQEANKKA